MTKIAGNKKLTEIERDGSTYFVIEINGKRSQFARIKFQYGRAREVGINGCHSEDLILIVKDRIEQLQADSFRAKAHEKIISHLNEILELLRSREEPYNIEALKIKLYGEQHGTG